MSNQSGKKHVLITGARGFIGKNLVELLASRGEFELFYPYHNELELLNSKKVEEYIDSNNIDIIVHCANRGGSRKQGYNNIGTDVFYKNTRIFFNLARLIKVGRRMIHLGSGAEFDRRNYVPQMKEDYFDAYVPEDDYGFSKYVCNKFISSTDKAILNLRLFGNFGKYEDYEFRFISNAIIKNLLHMPIVINQNVNFDFLDVNDLVKIISYFISNDTTQKVFNVSSGKVVDLVTIAKMINDISDFKSEIIIKIAGLNNEYSADNARLIGELKDFTFTPFEQALNELYQWYKRNLKEFDLEAVKKDKYLDACKVKKEE